jgi:hypothetical protein
MGIPMGPPPRAAIKPRVKMRPFHWVKIPQNLLPKTFWQGLMSRGDLPLDRDLLEDIFAADEAKVLKKKKKEQPKTLLDAKRGQNLGIFMSSFKMSITELDERLSALPPSDKCLQLEMVQSLRKLAPTPEEFESYKKYPGDKSQLSEIDQFLMRFMEVPNLKARLDLMLTIHEFPLQFEELAPEIELTLKACKEMLNNKKLESVLHVALSIGNYVNGGTAKGACHGFQLKTLPKMADARGRDKKTTLLDFMIMELKRGHKNLLDFDQQLEHASKAIESSVKVWDGKGVRWGERGWGERGRKCPRMASLHVVLHCCAPRVGIDSALSLASFVNFFCPSFRRAFPPRWRCWPVICSRLTVVPKRSRNRRAKRVAHRGGRRSSLRPLTSLSMALRNSWSSFTPT